MKYKRLQVGKISLVKETEDGRIQQIGLTEEGSELLQIMLGSLSKETPFVEMNDKYDLTLLQPIKDLKNWLKSELQNEKNPKLTKRTNVERIKFIEKILKKL